MISTITTVTKNEATGANSAHLKIFAVRMYTEIELSMLDYPEDHSPIENSYDLWRWFIRVRDVIRDGEIDRTDYEAMIALIPRFGNMVIPQSLVDGEKTNLPKWLLEFDAIYQTFQYDIDFNEALTEEVYLERYENLEKLRDLYLTLKEHYFPTMDGLRKVLVLSLNDGQWLIMQDDFYDEPVNFGKWLGENISPIPISANDATVDNLRYLYTIMNRAYRLVVNEGLKKYSRTDEYHISPGGFYYWYRALYRRVMSGEISFDDLEAHMNFSVESPEYGTLSFTEFVPEENRMELLEDLRDISKGIQFISTHLMNPYMGIFAIIRGFYAEAHALTLEVTASYDRLRKTFPNLPGLSFILREPDMLREPSFTTTTTD